jgi:hypothetical protein
VGHYLLQLQNNAPDAYTIMEEEIKEYLLSCKNN